MKQVIRNTVDAVSVGLVLAGAYMVHVGLAMMVVGIFGLLVVWQTEDNE